MVNFYVTLFLIFGTAIFLFFKSGSPKIKAKNLSLIMICLGINLLTSPMAYFIGGMATAPPDSTALDFLGGFLFIQGIPLLILLAAFWKFARAKKTKQV
ncbi:hypothetical protein ABE17_12995 [Bacillus mycoides]|uniref:hypothetical protein n=1 Tax=Bacillus cereus group TaxID=86661 RepID=UPI0018CDF408|nr:MULTISPECIES: hypothetical protein [Bacillus cereus group]MBG9597766.1 hypothetical protein [Bacillus mycoides]MBG9597801.1 hypothetical protein [Bacillus mycoides]